MAYQKIEQLNIYYEIHGKGEPLLFIHGLGSSSRDWEFQLADFSKRYQVILVDVRGHGRTDKATGEYSISLFSKDISKLMQQLDIESAHIIGLSMGGMIAFQLALNHPKLVKTMTIVNSGPNFIAADFVTKMKVSLRILMVKLLGLKFVAKKIAMGLFPKSDQQGLRELFISRFVSNDKASYLKSMRALVNWDVLSEISKITCPTLVIAADKDYTSVAMKKNYAEKMKNATLEIIPDSHHALPVEKPEVFNRAVLSFLENVKD